MRIHVTDAIWLNESDVCSIEHIADHSGLSLAEVRDLVDSGVIVPAEQDQQPPAFHLHHIVTARTARRLRDDFELDQNGVAVAILLLLKIRDLERQLRSIGRI